MQRLGDVAGHKSGVGARRRPFRDRRCDGPLVDVAHRAAALALATCPTGEHEQRNTPHACVEEADEAVCESWTGGDRRDPGLTCRQRPALCPEHRGTLVAGIDHPDIRVKARVEKGKDVPAGKSEYRADATLPEGLRQQSTAVGALLGVGARSLGRDVRHGFAVYRPRLSAGTALTRG